MSGASVNGKKDEVARLREECNRLQQVNDRLRHERDAALQQLRRKGRELENVTKERDHWRRSFEDLQGTVPSTTRARCRMYDNEELNRLADVVISLPDVHRVCQDHHGESHRKNKLRAFRQNPDTLGVTLHETVTVNRDHYLLVDASVRNERLRTQHHVWLYRCKKKNEPFSIAEMCVHQSSSSSREYIVSYMRGNGGAEAHHVYSFYVHYGVPLIPTAHLESANEHEVLLPPNFLVAYVQTGPLEYHVLPITGPATCCPDARNLESQVDRGGLLFRDQNKQPENSDSELPCTLM